MNIHSYLSKFFNKIEHFINSLIIKISKKLNIKEKKVKILNFIRFKNVLILIFIFLVLIFTYLSIPILYNKSQIENYVKNQLLNKYDLKFKFSTDLDYNLFPRPNYTFKNVKFSNNDLKLAEVESLKINLKITKFFSLKDIKIKDILLKHAKFEVNKKNLNFFFNFLNNNTFDSEIKIIDSYIFFKENEDEVLLINKINKMHYYYDTNIAQNILSADNEIFNIPYTLKIYNNQRQKKIFSKVKINTLKSIFDYQYDYSKNIKKGFIDLATNKNKSKISFIIDDEKLSFKFLDEMNNYNFKYNGTIDLKPFFMNLDGKIKRLNLDYLKDSNSILVQFLKTEILNNQNLNFSSIINIEKILPYQKLIDLLLHLKIKEGLIDIDESKFSWSNYAEFEITDSLIYSNDNALALDGTMNIDIKNYNEIYRFFQTPRNFRKEIHNLNFVFNYNFDKEIINISKIKINNQENKKVGEILNKLVSQDNFLQNRIYLKNLINKAIKAYSG